MRPVPPEDLPNDRGDPSESSSTPAPDRHGAYVRIGSSEYVAFVVESDLARLGRVTSNPDGSLTVHVVGSYERLDRAVQAGHWHADRQARADAARYECSRCGCPIEQIGGVWTVVDHSTTAGGLTYCPPDPDAEPVGNHIPRRRDQQ